MANEAGAGKEPAIEGAIFDCDDTLVDSLWMWRSIVPRVYGRHYDGDSSELQARGESMGMDEALALFVRETGIDATPEQLKAEMLDEVHYGYAHDVKVFPGAVEFLDTLRAMGVPLAVCSCTLLEEVENCLGANGIRDRFDAIVSASQGYPGKHSPDIYEAALAALGTPKERTWVFEDSLTGAETAHKAGFPVVGVVWEKSGGDPVAMARVADVVLAEGWEGFTPSDLVCRGE